MWLVDTQTLELKEFLGVDPPPYAILSHTWDIEEVSFREMINGATPAAKAKKGYLKIEQTCRIAAEAAIDYAWVDTCCIDKSSSAELTEAINSMFQWYERAEICYAYLPDLPPEVSSELAFPSCRWFTRGWTLQELLAPANLVFYDAEWQRRSTKNDAAHTISQVTGIDSDYIWYPGRLRHASVAERMSWASRRTTTRVEDMAYCLLGLFDITMPMLYGEGQKAFLRLQEEIVKRTNDLSLLAWKAEMSGEEQHSCCGVLAASPSVFRSSGTLLYGSRENEFSVTNKGIKITTQLHTARLNPARSPVYVLHVGDNKDYVPVYVVLLKLDRDVYVRDLSSEGGLRDSPVQLGPPLPKQTLYLAHDPSYRVGGNTILKKRLGATKLILTPPGRVKVFEVVPESIWDPATSMLLDPSAAVALLLGVPGLPYGSVWLVILQRRTMGTIYSIPASSPAIPYVLSNLATLSSRTLDIFWNIHPVMFVPCEDNAAEGYHDFLGTLTDIERLKTELLAGFREVYATTPGVYDVQGPPVLQLNFLKISAFRTENEDISYLEDGGDEDTNADLLFW